MLTPQLEELKLEVLRGVEAVLAARGCIPLGSEGFPQKMTTRMVATRLGMAPQTVTCNWRKWGLRKIGRGANGFIFEGYSVSKYIERVNAESQ